MAYVNLWNLINLEINQDVCVGEERGVCQYVSNCYLRWDLTNFLHIINGVFIEDLVAQTTLKDNISRKLCLASGGKRILFLIRTLAKPLAFEKFVKTKELNKKFGSSLPTDPRYLAKQNLDNFHQKSCMAGECHKYILKPPLFTNK